MKLGPACAEGAEVTMFAGRRRLNAGSDRRPE